MASSSSTTLHLYIKAITDMSRKIALGIIWLVFTAYTIWLAPVDHPATFPLVKNLLTGHWNEVNAILVAIFWLMGVWPMIYACLMFFDGRMQRIPAWPYFLAANGTGVIGLIPYLELRDRNQSFQGSKDKWLRQLDSRGMAILLSVITLALLTYAALRGDWSEFIQQWRSLPFVHLITLDFCLMCVVFPLTSLLDDDMARRGLENQFLFWAVAFIPLFGPLAYLYLRPPLKD